MSHGHSIAQSSLFPTSMYLQFFWFFFDPEKVKKRASKVAHNRPRPFYFTVQPSPAQLTAHNQFFILWNLGTRHLFSYLCRCPSYYYYFRHIFDGLEPKPWQKNEFHVCFVHFCLCLKNSSFLGVCWSLFFRPYFINLLPKSIYQWTAKMNSA